MLKMNPVLSSVKFDYLSEKLDHFSPSLMEGLGRVKMPAHLFIIFHPHPNPLPSKGEGIAGCFSNPVADLTITT
jgi:hypothetical protein